MILRDHLAMDRTKLANTRTFLAYFRTGIMLVGSGVTFIKVFSQDLFMVILGVVFAAVGALVLVAGAVNYFSMRAQMEKYYPEGELEG